MAADRNVVAAGEDMDLFALRYGRERLAVLDRDIETIVELAGGELTNAYQFFRVAEAMAELGRDELVLAWTTRGFGETDGWQVGTPYDLACETRARRGETLNVLRLRRAQHERMPSLSTHTAQRAAAEKVDACGLERDAARGVIRRADVRGFVDALLRDGDAELAWEEAVAAPGQDSRCWDEETGKPPAQGVYASQRLSLGARGQARDLTNECRAEVRTGLGKSDRPGSQRGFGNRGQSELCLRATRAPDFYLDNRTHGLPGSRERVPRFKAGSAESATGRN